MNDIEEKYFLTRGKAILFSFILIVVITIFVVIKIVNKNQIQKYKNFETQVKAAGENYYAIKNLDIDYGEELRISKKKIMGLNLIYDELANKCNFYVMVSNEKNIVTGKYEINYLPYIKCGNSYMTSNYSEY